MKLRGGVIVGGSKVKKDRYLFASKFTSGKKVLDIGCGCGWGLLQIVDGIKEAVAMDIYEETLLHARRRFSYAPKVTVRQGDAQDIPFKDKSFDATICYEVIEHLDRPEACISEVERVTREVALFSTPDRRFWGNPVGSRARFHKKHYTREELEEALSKHFKTRFVSPRESGVHSGTMIFVCTI